MNSDKHEQSRLLTISPVKDGPRHLDETMSRMVAQEHHPNLWGIINAGGTDTIGRTL